MMMLPGKNDDATSSTSSVKTNTSSIVFTCSYRPAGPQPPSSQGHIYISTAMMSDVFMALWVTQFGVPSTLTLDIGTQFISAVWMNLCFHLGVHHITTIAYHPQSKDMIEQVHQHLTEPLRARLVGVNWMVHLPWVLLGLCVSPQDD
jgi:hypothetical protein